MKTCKHYWRAFKSYGIIEEDWMLCSNCGVAKRIVFPKVKKE